MSWRRHFWWAAAFEEGEGIWRLASGPVFELVSGHRFFAAWRRARVSWRGNFWWAAAFEEYEEYWRLASVVDVRIGLRALVLRSLRRLVLRGLRRLVLRGLEASTGKVTEAFPVSCGLRRV